MSSTEQRTRVESPTADREIVVARTIDARRDLVFEAFTEVRHLAQWWGPEGFTTTTKAFDFRVGAVWDFTMHGPDGTDYPEWITWTEITPPERIAVLHGEHRDDPNSFESVFTFTAVGDTTTIELRTVFATQQQRDEAIEKHGAIVGAEQTLDHLRGHVTGVG